MPFLKGFSEIQAHKVLKTVSKHRVNNQMLIFLTMTPSDCDNSISTSSNWWLPFTDAHAQSTPEFTPLSEYCFIDCSSVPCGASLCNWVASLTLVNRTPRSPPVPYLPRATTWSQYASSNSLCSFDSLNSK